MKKTKIKLVLMMAGLGLSMLAVSQPQMMNSFGAGLQNFLNFGTNSSTTGSEIPVITGYAYPGNQANTKVFDQGLQQELLSSALPKVDGGLNQQTLKTTSLTNGMYFDFETGQSSPEYFTTADVYVSLDGRTCQLNPVESSSGLNLGAVPFSSVDYTSLAGSDLTSDLCAVPTQHVTKFLFDEAHSPFLNYNVNGKMSNLYGNVTALGYNAQVFSDGVLSYDYLSQFDVLVIYVPQSDYSADEISAIGTFVNQGGNLLMIADGFQFTDIPNSIVSQFSYQYARTTLISDEFAYTTHYGTDSNTNVYPSSNMAPRNLLTKAVGSIVLDHYSAISEQPDTADSIVFTDSGSYFYSNETPANEVTVISALNSVRGGNGKILLSPDLNIFDNHNMQYLDNYQFVKNVINWLGGAYDLTEVVSSPVHDKQSTSGGLTKLGSLSDGDVLLFQTTEGNLVRTTVTFGDTAVQMSYDYLYYISIDGNEDLLSKASQNDWPGDGSAENPIVISGYNLNEISNIGGFSLANTNLYVKFQDNNLNGLGSFVDGFSLNSVSNVALSGNAVSGYLQGAVVTNSYNVQFDSNSFSSNSLQGVLLTNSYNVSVSGNTFENNGASGLTVNLCGGVYVSENTFQSNAGVVLDNSDILASEITFVESYGSINGNSVTLGNGYGLLVLGIGVSGVSDGVAVNAKLMQSSESNLQVSNNDISSNALDGVSVLSSDLVSFESNSVDSNLGAGISVSSSTNVAISDNDITFNGQDGIYWVHSWYGTISGNVVENNSNLQLVAAKTGKTSGFASYSGMFMDPSFYNTIDGNSFSSNAFGVSLEQSDFNNFTQNDISSNAYNGFSVVNSSSNNILGNTITGNVNPYLAQELNQYLKPESVSGFASYSGMFMDPSENNVLEGNTIEGNYGYGLHLLDSTNNTINSNDVNQNAQDGAFIENSDYNKITNNNFTGNSNLDLQAVYLKVMKPGSVGGFASYSGMFMDPSNFNFVANNNFDGNSGTGVYVQASNNNTFGYNKITNNALDGFFLENSSDNQVGYNTITGNVDPTLLGELLSYQKLDRLSGFASYSGMFMDPSHGNQVFGNYIADNYGNGALIQDSDNNLFAGNQLTGNAGSGVAMVDSNNNEISKNTISANSNAALQFKFQNALGSNKPDGFSGFASYSGMFMDPSHGNTVTGNVISDSPEHGVWLQSSSDNVFDGNTISNSGQHGFFIENSNDNTIKNNDIGNNGNETVLNSFLAYGKPEGFTGFASYSGMFMDPSSGNVIENNKVHDNNGFGISTLDSDGNTLKGNKISYNSKEGLNVESSNKLSIQENSFAYNAKYGLKFDQLSKESSVGKNDFVANKGGSQAYDDGGNSFSGNFYLDENPNRAYTIDGSAKTKDYKVSTSPSTDLSSLNFPPVEVGTYILPSKINVGDNHRYLGAWIHFPDGYSSYLVNKTSLYAEFNGENYRVLRAYSFGNHWMYLKIDLRSLGHDLYNYLVSNKLSVTTFDLTIHGSFNGGFLDFYGTDTLVAYKHHKDHDDHHHHRGH